MLGPVIEANSCPRFSLDDRGLLVLRPAPAAQGVCVSVLWGQANRSGLKGHIVEYSTPVRSSNNLALPCRANLKSLVRSLTCCCKKLTTEVDPLQGA